MEKTHVTVEMPTTLERRARIEAAKAGFSRSELLRLAIEHYLQKLENSNQTGKGQKN